MAVKPWYLLESCNLKKKSWYNLKILSFVFLWNKIRLKFYKISKIQKVKFFYKNFGSDIKLTKICYL